ncbi:MAG: ATP-binding cassette domain-containing protein, partial [Romboutsia sp.]|nr:ATP-binding cassette domain-containing protein [Romboutsia sp.]
VAFPDRGNVLSNININIPKGKIIALVGPSGSGKTTILNLLLGILEDFSGEVTFDGINTKDLDKKSLFSKVGYVDQDIFLFSGSIKDNIRFFNSNITEQQIIKAAMLANIHDFINELPDKYNTQVGENGINLSGGQKQRLSLARAIINEPEILLLDEATSALDSLSEQIVLSAIRKAAENRTVIMVTHRLASIKWADYIYMFNNGNIIEHGSWDELAGNKSNKFVEMLSN